MSMRFFLTTSCVKYIPKYILFISISVLILTTLGVCKNETTSKLKSKQIAIESLRKHFSKNRHRGHQLKRYKLPLDKYIKLLDSNGEFTDLKQELNEIRKKKLHLNKYGISQKKVSKVNTIAFNRLWKIAESMRGNKDSNLIKNSVFIKLCKGIILYGNLELSRANVSGGRFHPSCFAIPTAAINIYFSLFDMMNAVETKKQKSERLVEINDVLKRVGMQSWTQPYRKDKTDLDVVQVDRFRGHVWWVGGNAISYRSVLPASVMMSSIKMIDVLAKVYYGSLSVVSQNTYDKAFWVEGCTADGAGWGHGKQCLVWGYPADGLLSALKSIKTLKETPWGATLTEDNKETIFNYIRGSSWYYYKGLRIPATGRGSMGYKTNKTKPKTLSLVKILKNNWFDFLTSSQKKEIKALETNMKNERMRMLGFPQGMYNGTRWFYNNDNLVKKNDNYHIYVSMASVRCDGIESAYVMADGYNFYTCDGMTLYQREGNEYSQAMGGWNLTAIPGVTSRQGEDKLKPIVNWRGYCSKHNYAGAATSGKENAVSGFQFEKLNASQKKNVNDREGLSNDVEILYGVSAHKFTMMAGDYMLSLGSGINNLKQGIEGDIWTTVDQTLWQNSVKVLGEDSLQKSYSLGKNKRIVLKKASEGVVKDREILWAFQKNGFAYGVLPSQTTGEVVLTLQNRKTKWKKLNYSNKKKKDLPKKVNIFQLHINHGKKVKDDRYGYITYCGTDTGKIAFNKNPFLVIENTTNIQAAQTTDGSVIGVSFYNNKKTLNAKDWSMSVSVPCVLLLEKEKSGYRLTVTDPKLNNNCKKIIVKTTLKLKEGASVKKKGKWNVIKVDMKVDQQCGKPQSILLVDNK